MFGIPFGHVHTNWKDHDMNALLLEKKNLENNYQRCIKMKGIEKNNHSLRAAGATGCFQCWCPPKESFARSPYKQGFLIPT